LVPLDSAMADEPEGSLGYGGNWRASATIGGSPGKPDPILTPGVLLNEITAHTDIDFPPYDSNDWIELYNASESDVLLNHWYLSDDPTDLKKWEIPANTSISSGGRISFDEIHDFHQPITEGFGLNKAGEQVLLSHLSGTSEDRVVDAVRFKGQENGFSLGRTPDGGAYWDILFPTRDTPNGERLVSLVISELMYHPETEDASHEYVELYNPTGETVELWNETGSWRINGGIEYFFPAGTSMPAGGYLLLVNFDPADTTPLTGFTGHYGLDPAEVTLLGPYQGNLSNQGDRVAIERPQDSDDPLVPDAISWVVVDEAIYFDQSPWPLSPDGGGKSLQRDSVNRPGTDPSNWFGDAPTPFKPPSPRTGTIWLLR
jgi:hypothetical protein